MKISKLLAIATGFFLGFGGLGYWYVFIAGAPQFDPPDVSAQGTDMTFQLESFKSVAMGKTRQYGVILPPNYHQNTNQRYPVIFLLHGGHDDARAWADKYGIIPVLHQLYQEKKLPYSIIITPDGNDNRGSSALWDPQYFDGANGKLGTLIGSELVQEVKSRYRTLNQPQFWALGGLSSGGWGAFNIGLRHLNNFHILFSHSGYFTDTTGAANSPNLFIQKLPKSDLIPLRVYLDAGKSDSDLLASTQQFHQTLQRLGIENVFYAFPGGHGLSGPDYGWNYFHKHAVDSLSYVGQQFKSALEQLSKSSRL
ncbi:alpha/beta hydrolase [Gloeothece verrucosa]|uniref:Putative esterase n=1 Tax=Gloeothece verrucosa (strain PCC 7822) TaxID=497965 RepID=E0UEG4_GLOV7|nr:alpha/beta hydrolase-fold protein [Gloeothece verrucosa]ADN15410.1 putative esterase [Gloeothece verrucosa PCC 7822]